MTTEDKNEVVENAATAPAAEEATQAADAPVPTSEAKNEIEKHDNKFQMSWAMLAWSICMAVFGSSALAAISIVYTVAASKQTSKAEYDKKLKVAKTCNIINIVVAVLLTLLVAMIVCLYVSMITGVMYYSADYAYNNDYLY